MPTFVTEGKTSFKTIAVSDEGQDPIVADSGSDTLTLVAGDNITLTTNATTDTVTIASSGGGGGGGARRWRYFWLRTRPVFVPAVSSP